MARLLFGLVFALLLLTSSFAQPSSSTSIDSAGGSARLLVGDSTVHDSSPQTEQVSDTVRATSKDSITGAAGILLKNGQPLYPLTPERRAMLSEYAKKVNAWRFVDFVSGVIIFAVILFAGLSARFRNIAKTLKPTYLMIWLYSILLFVAIFILSFPFTYYRSFYLEVQYGFMNQTFGAWLGEQLLSLAVTVVIAPIPIWFLYFVIQRFKRWWLAFSIGALPILVVFIVIAPVLISPLFNKFEPLKDKNLEREILTLASQAGIEGSDVFEVNASKQSSKVNAYVTGLFGTKRIVLYDTLIKGFTYDEIKFVMGHEMGHYIMRHIWWGLGLAVLSLLVMLWVMDKVVHRAIHRWRHQLKFDRLGDIASLPLVLALVSVFGFFTQPIGNYASRYMEHQSDIFGMNVTTVSGEEAATAFDKLSAYNLADPDPSPLMEIWFYDHPALRDRMAFVKQYRAEHPVSHN